MIYWPDHTSALGMHFFSKTNAWKMAWYIKIVRAVTAKARERSQGNSSWDREQAEWWCRAAAQLRQQRRVGRLPGAGAATCSLWVKRHWMGSQASGADGLHHPQAHRPLNHVSFSTRSFLLSSMGKKKNVSLYWYLPTFFSETYFLLHFQSNILSLQMRKKDTGNKRQRIIF